MVTAGVSALVTLLLSVGVIPRIINDQNLNAKHENAVKSLRKVHTIKASLAPNNEQGILPANITAIQQITINARIDGYLKQRYVDIGDVVKAGQLLAEIEVPTVVEEVAQANADFNEARATLIGAQETLKETQSKAASAHALVNKAKADYDYALITAKRWENMAANGSVSLQSRDEKIRARDAQLATLESSKAQATAADDAVETARAQITVAKAAVVANDAKFRRTKAKEDFKYVRAPFDGVITDRKVDAGALINAGGSSSTALFDMANIDNLRIYINVPQTVSRFMKPGQKTVITVSELAGQNFPGLITKVSGALDPQTRTRQTEIRIPNPTHKLYPGMYAQVQLTVDRPEQWVIIPGTTLVPQPDGMKVVVVEDGKAVYKTVVMGRNLGDDVEIKEGLRGGELLVINPPVDLLPGEAVDTTAGKGVSASAD
jgi:RND family efflux transporter MFP subunit